MYEKVTYESILNQMLHRVPTDLDKREGSVIYTALAPAAVEMQLMYIELDTILCETFGDTASREYLIRRAAERGILPSPETKAVLKAEVLPVTMVIPAGERFRLGALTYIVLENTGDGTYKVECEIPGSAGNRQLGALLPIAYMSGLESIRLTEVLIPGEDEEETKSLRARYLSSFHEQAFGGNKKDYLNKTHSIPGVGAVKVTRAWNGGSTVKLTILAADYNKASNTLIQSVQNTIDPTQDGAGDGLAPIDHIVTVDTAEEVQVSVQTQVRFDNGYSYSALQEQMAAAIKEYLLELRKTWADISTCIVRISQIETRLLAIQGILDIGNTRINGGEGNLELSEYQIPVYGGVTVD